MIKFLPGGCAALLIAFLSGCADLNAVKYVSTPSSGLVSKSARITASSKTTVPSKITTNVVSVSVTTNISYEAWDRPIEDATAVRSEGLRTEPIPTALPRPVPLAEGSPIIATSSIVSAAPLVSALPVAATRDIVTTESLGIIRTTPIPEAYTIPLRVAVAPEPTRVAKATPSVPPIALPEPAVTPPTPDRPFSLKKTNPNSDPIPPPSIKPATAPMKTFAVKDGETVHEYTLTNANGAELKVINYGCIVTSLKVPDRDGTLVDVALGHDNLKSYENDSPYFGCMVGRNGNRIANAAFKLDGKTYALAANNGEHSLHGGEKGFDKVVWLASALSPQKIKFFYDAKDGEEGFPGNLSAEVTYELTDDNAFNILVRATTDAPTICNIVHHSYWNLEGHNAGKIYDHDMQIFADNYTPVDDTLIPTGQIAPVAGTALDFRSPKRIGQDIQKVGGDPVGYDHNFVVNGTKNQLRPVAKVSAPKSGIVMEIEANQPGVQFYTGNFLEGHSGKEGADYQQHEGFCLETQLYPDSANKEGLEGWPSAILRPGTTYEHRMNHKFSVAK